MIGMLNANLVCYVNLMLLGYNLCFWPIGFLKKLKRGKENFVNKIKSKLIIIVLTPIKNYSYENGHSNEDKDIYHTFSNDATYMRF